ncbi:Zinc finger CCCH domain-containing protein 6 [Raphanus sativus]|uniref:Zinc finger CCCH domain-containing protein 6 n=1 Tax=Raphanus sativus TaxID=3726 RepID=A0A6J0JVJ8_RAPSA|nr:zinc finger CCCH domain-containing protein 6 [Raphanus sativus]KAJ4916220.1 Zinc finger CCCH domain-containing protein 6 [Raphanus sativus]
MRALQKSKRVSWPPDFKLCQVRLFTSEDSPSQVGSESQDHFQAKSWEASHPSDEDNLPPGFGGLFSPNESLINLSDIPIIKWQCSVRILLDEEWSVVAGDESKEVEAQNQRELRVLEAFYPAASSIPPNPSVAADVDNSDYDDQQTVVIPFLVVEDDDVVMDTAPILPTQSGVDVGTVQSVRDENTSTSSTLPPATSEIMAALAALSNIKEQGSSSMIDPDLLMKFLSNPKMMESLVANCGSAGSVSSSSATHEANGVVTTTAPVSSNGQYNPQPAVSHIPPPMVYPPTPAPSDQSNYGAPPPLAARDASYYKSLIQKHGGERQEALPAQQHLGGYRHSLQPGRGEPNPEMVNNNNNNNNQRPRDSKPKIMRPCMFFNTPRGCRNGASCLFQHDATTTAYQPRNINNRNINNNPEMQFAKRMRFDRV